MLDGPTAGVVITGLIALSAPITVAILKGKRANGTTQTMLDVARLETNQKNMERRLGVVEKNTNEILRLSRNWPTKSEG